MTDEKIKEEFEEWACQPFGEGEIRFCRTTSRPTVQASAYYAGFRSAERLVKIDVLEELILRLEDAEQDAYIIAEIKDKLNKLKAGQ